MRQLRVTTRSHLPSVASFSASGQFRASRIARSDQRGARANVAHSTRVGEGKALETFSNVNRAAVKLRAVLPSVLLPKLDFSTLRVRPGSFVDGSLRQVHSDLL